MRECREPIPPPGIAGPITFAVGLVVLFICVGIGCFDSGHIVCDPAKPPVVICDGEAIPNVEAAWFKYQSGVLCYTVGNIQTCQLRSECKILRQVEELCRTVEE